MRRTLLRGAICGVLLAAGWLACAASVAAGQRLEPDRIVEPARATLEAHLAARSERRETRAIGSVDAIVVASGAVTIAVRPIAAGEPLAPRMQVWVDVRVDDRFVRTLPVAFEVRAFTNAWVATRDARIGDRLESAAPVRRSVDIAALAAEPLVELPSQARLRRPLFAGQPVSALHVEPIPEVQRGAPVVVRSRIGSIAVETRAESLQDGRAGSQVWVRLATSTGPVRGRVVAEATVEVDHE